MVIRITSAVLWFIAMSWAANFASAFVGLSPVLGFGSAAAIGAFIGTDPLRLLWPTPREAASRSAAHPANLAAQRVQTVR
jgi:hypothetical protein